MSWEYRFARALEVFSVALVLAFYIASGQLGDMKLEDIPGPEALLRPGNRSGQTILVRRGNMIECHQVDCDLNSPQKYINYSGEFIAKLVYEQIVIAVLLHPNVLLPKNIIPRNCKLNYE